MRCFKYSATRDVSSKRSSPRKSITEKYVVVVVGVGAGVVVLGLGAVVHGLGAVVVVLDGICVGGVGG